MCSSDLGVPFTFFEPPQVSSVEPAAGIVYGGTTVTVHGSGFGADMTSLAETNRAREALGMTPLKAEIQCRFGDTLPNSNWDPTRQMWYGDSIVRGSIDNATAARCIAPPSNRSGASRVLRLRFEASLPLAASVEEGSGELGSGWRTVHLHVCVCVCVCTHTHTHTHTPLVAILGSQSQA